MHFWIIENDYSLKTVTTVKLVVIGKVAVRDAHGSVAIATCPIQQQQQQLKQKGEMQWVSYYTFPPYFGNWDVFSVCRHHRLPPLMSKTDSAKPCAACFTPVPLEWILALNQTVSSENRHWTLFKTVPPSVIIVTESSAFSASVDQHLYQSKTSAD